MKIALSLVLFLAACDTAYVGTTTSPPYQQDPCSFQIYQTLGCNSGYDWSGGHYDSFHVWVRPRYTRRVIVAPTYHTTTIIGAPMRSVYVPRPLVTHTVIVRPASSSGTTRSTYTVTRRRR